MCNEKCIQMGDEKYVVERLEKQQAWYSNKSSDFKKWCNILGVIQIIILGVVPVANLLNVPRLWISVVTGIAAILLGLSNHFKLREQWLSYRTVSESLKHHKYLYLTHTFPYEEHDRFHTLVVNVEQIISTENSNWSQLMKKGEDQNGI